MSVQKSVFINAAKALLFGSVTRRRFLIAFLILGLLGIGGAWTAGSIMSRPVSSAVPPPEPPARLVRMVASDGVQVEGSYWPGAQPDAPAVLLLHGVNSSRASFTRHALWLNRFGYAVLAIDFRGHGGSGAVARSFGLHEARDAAAALAFLRRDFPARRVGLIGTSLGGAAALLGDRGPLPVQAMVLQAVYPDLRSAIANRIAARVGRPLSYFGEPLLSYQSLLRLGVWPGRLSPRDAIRRYRGPVLIIGGMADEYTPIGETQAVYAAAPGPKALLPLHGVGHSGAGSVWTDDYRHHVRSLFARTLGEPGAARDDFR